MAIDIPPSSQSPITATNTGGAANNSGAQGVVDSKTLASNFTSFLQLLTTQLKNQNPMDPLDTNQFTQQLVQFAQVEQQLKSNDQLTTLVALQKTAQSTTALGYVGQTVAVDGANAKLSDGEARWSFNPAKPATATVTIKSATGLTVYTGTFGVQAGPQNFVWDGKGNNGAIWPDGNYTVSVTAKDANGQTTAIAPEVQGLVDSVDLTKTPPLLAIAGQEYTLDQIKRVVRTSN